MLTTNDVSRLFDTIMSIPGMNDTVKIDIKISRKNALLLNSVIRRGLAVKDDEKSSVLLKNLPDDTMQQLAAIANDCLTKAGLTELSEKLSTFGSEK